MDTLIIGSDGNHLVELSDKIIKFQSKTKDRDLKTAELLRSNYGIYARYAYKCAKNAYISTPYGELLLDISLAHFTDDYIMDPILLYPGLTIDEILSKVGRTEIYSDKIISLFSQIGFDTVQGDSKLKLELKTRETKTDLITRLVSKTNQMKDKRKRKKYSKDFEIQKKDPENEVQ